MLRAVAQRYKVPVLYCNLVGGNDELIFDGNSVVFDASGHLLAQGAAFAEDLVIVDLAGPCRKHSIPWNPPPRSTTRWCSGFAITRRSAVSSPSSSA